MSITATAARSAVLASAPPPKLYALGQDWTSYQADNVRTLSNNANALVAEFRQIYEAPHNIDNKFDKSYGTNNPAVIKLTAKIMKISFEDAQKEYERCKKIYEYADKICKNLTDYLNFERTELACSTSAFMICSGQAKAALVRATHDARQAETDAAHRAAGMYCYTSEAKAAANAALPVAKYQGFDSVEAAKSFAFQQLDQLKAGIASHNSVFGNWDKGGAQKQREMIWQSNFDAIKRSRPDTSDADAIKHADEMLLRYIQTSEGLRGYLPGQGPLENMFDLSGPLFTENADGTLTLNNVQGRYNGVLIFEIGTPTAQAVDKVA